MRRITQRETSREMARSWRAILVLLSIFCACAPFAAASQAADSAAKSVDDMPVSVQLRAGRERVSITVPPGAPPLTILDGRMGKPLAGAERMQMVSVKASGTRLLVNGRDANSSLIVIASPGGIIIVNGNRYRGSIEVEARGGQTRLVNVLPLRWYLASVLGAEMPNWAPIAALKAQSVVSRSYILHRIVADDAPYPPVCDSIFSQVYKGLSSENPMTIEAVRETEELVLIENGSPIDACFSASSGGHTASAEDVWGNEVSYLIGKGDPFSEGGEYGEWRLEVPPDECEQLLAGAGHDVGALQEIVVIKADRSGRACRVALIGTRGNVLMRGTDFRMLLGTTRLRSTMFDVERRPAGFVFYGKGYGHGVGLSQQGACKMAQAGYSFQQILHFYYTGVTLESYSPLANR